MTMMDLGRAPGLWERVGASGVLFGLRMTATVLTALWLAMWLQFDTPRWAAWTAMSLALPTRGEVAAKGAWRAIGTVVGIAVGILAMAAFAQSPFAMGLFLAAWFALNAYVGGRLPGMAAYGAILAGFTAGFIAILAGPAPLSTFTIAMARGADILLGVACIYVASTISEALRGLPASPPPAAAKPTTAQAVANGVRAFVVVAASWAIWTATAWPSGGIFVIFAGVVAMFFAAMPDPDRRAQAYLWGVALGQGVGLFVKYFLLGGPSSFVLLAAILSPFIFIGAVGMTNPRTAVTASGYNLSFLLAVDPANPMQYDIAASLNEAAAIFAGLSFGAAAFSVVLRGRVWRTAG